MLRVGGAQWLYMAEQEGLLNTRESHIIAAIKEFKQYKNAGYDINDEDLQERVLSKYKLSNLSQKESCRIAQEVGRQERKLIFRKIFDIIYM